MACRSLGFALALSLALVSGPALGQGRAAPAAEPVVVGSGPDYEVTFTDDPLAALPKGVILAKIRVREEIGYTALMRPRTSYVRELLKSADVF